MRFNTVPQRSRVLVALALCLLTAMAVAPASAQSRTFVTVLADDGSPITDLTAADFVAFVDGVPQEIVRVAPATEPLSIVLLTDQLYLGRTYTLTDIRQSMASFVSAIRAASPGSSFALMTFDGSVRPVTAFQSAPVLLDQAIARLNGVGDDAYLMDAVARASQLSFPTGRRAMVSLLGTFRPERSVIRTDDLGNLLRESRASFWAIEALDRDRSAVAHPPRELILEVATELSGGAREIVSSPEQLAAAIGRIATSLLAQYEVVYGPGRRTSSSRLTIGVRRPNVKVLASGWISITAR